MLMTGALLLKLLCSQYGICGENTRAEINSRKDSKSTEITFLDMSSHDDKPESEFPEVINKGHM